MQFTAKFTTLACAVAAMLSQVTAKPAPVDTIHANITHVGNAMDSATPRPAASYVFGYSTKILADNTCSTSLSDSGTVTVLNEGQCTPIRTSISGAAQNVQCTRPPSVDPAKVFVCPTATCAEGCSTLNQDTFVSGGYYITTNAKYIFVRD
ncbi:hypothetical protein OH76DRAFT_1479175 [Lentinus brumalis]|uniref:Uncharacterized protein n=1 Tax=Lentinus brumalis TaxID=2498619 RepID=A0A371DNP3_9APHY|nr:hypothetical protein OH76DRAFT_1479175 [Polyporus brumalis]